MNMRFSLRRCALLLALAFGGLGCASGQTYTSIVVFGDSLSDTGNIAHLTQAQFAFRYPSAPFGYTDGRFTDGADTVPAATKYTGLWIEQLAAMLPNKPVIKSSLDGGTDYAYGDATTADGTSPITDDGLTIQVNNLGQQVRDYLSTRPVITPQTLFVVWGGANDLLMAKASADVSAAVTRELAVVQQLIAAGATDIIVPDLPPLGLVPELNGDPIAAGAATDAAHAFSVGLFAGLQALPAQNAGKVLHLFPLDVFSLIGQVIVAPAASGFVNVKEVSQGATVDPDTYLFWDKLHPTTAGHYLLAQAAAKLITPAGPVATTTTVATSASNVNLNNTVTFTATVAALAGVPTGTVTFLDGTTTLGTGALTGTGITVATATFATAALAVGAHSITANYGGDTGFSASVSPAVSIDVLAATIAVSASPSSLTIARGASGNTTISITPSGGATGSVTLGCASLPAHFTCSFAPASVTLDGTATVQTATLTIGTSGAAAAMASPARHAAFPGLMAALLLPCWGGLALLGLRRGRSIRLLSLLLLLLGSGALAGLSGCGGSDSNKVASGTYSVLVDVIPNGNVRATTVPIQVVVQ